MAYKVNDDMMTPQDLVSSSVTPNWPQGQIVRGQDPNLGAGEFMYVRGTGTILLNDTVEFSALLASGNLSLLVQQWAGTVILGKSLGVAMAVLTGNLYGWVQIAGQAIANISGAPAVGNAVYWQAAGVVSPTPVAGKQVIGGMFTSAANATIGSAALGATKAIIMINRPSGQAAIT